MPTRLTLPALDPSTVTEKHGSGYPEPFKSRMGDRLKQRLGDALGLSQFGVNLVRLGPGGQSALRHWHTHEDEFVYVLEGSVTLVTDAGSQTLRAGDCIGYPAGVRDAHQLRNEGREVAIYLEVGSRSPQDLTAYPHDDLMLVRRETLTRDGNLQCEEIATHKDGSPY